MVLDILYLILVQLCTCRNVVINHHTETNRPVFFGIDGTKEGLEAVKDGTLAATVYNDKEGQAAAMANLAFSIATEDENNPNPFKNYKYIYRAYQKVTKENAQTFLEKEE